MTTAKTNRFPRAFDRRLAWVAAGLLPLFIFAIVMLIMFTRQQEQAIERLLREAAAGAAHVVDRAVGEQLGIMKGMAASMAFDRGDFTTIRSEAQRLWDMHPEWRTVIVTDEHRPLMNLRSPLGGPITPLRDPESLARVWSTGKPSVGNLVSDHVGLRVPVAPEGRMAYTIAVPVDPRFFRDILAKHRLEQPWSAAVIGSDRAVIAATPDSPLKEGQPLPEKFGPAAGGFRAAEADYQTWAPVGTSGWSALIIAPAAAVERPFARARTAVLVGGACSAVLTAFLVAFLSSAWAARRETTRLRSEISERERVENALRESEERFRRFAENANEGIWALDADQRVTFANRRLAEMLGTSIDGLIGRPAVDYIFPGELADHGAEMEARRKGEHSSYERRMLHKDGTPVWTLVSAVPILDSAGRFAGSFGMFTDITARKAVDQAIRESEERFRLTFDTSPDSININRLEDGLYVEVNQGFTALTGWRREEVLGRTSLEINIWHDPGDRRRLVERLNATGVCDNLQAQFRRKDGSLATALMSARVLSLNGVRHIVSITRDISQRIAAEAALRESEERYRQVVDLVPDAISIFVDERFVFTNRSGLAMVGAADVDALHGRLVWDFTHPRYVRLGQERYRKCLRDGTPLPPAEFELIGPGGRPTHIESSAVPIRYQGSPALLAVWRDVTSRKAAESALRENEELFRGTFDFSPIGQTMSDLDYRYLRCNEAFCRFLGYPERELVGRSVPDVTHPEDRHTRSVVRELVDGKTGQAQFQKRYIRRDGSVVWGDVTVRLVRSPEGVPRHMLSVVQDITERVLNAQEKEKLEAQLRQAQKMEALGTLAGGIAHDFNNILGVIIGGAEMLELTDAARDSSRDTLANIMGASQRARDLVKQILAFSRHTRQERILLNLKIHRQGDGRFHAGVAAVDHPAAALHRVGIGRHRRRPDADAAGPDESLHQRRPRHGTGRRHPADQDGRCGVGCIGRAIRRGSEAGEVCAGNGDRHGARHRPGRDPADIRALLHHQGKGEGNRPRARGGTRHRDGPQRGHHGLQRTGQRDDVRGLPAVCRGICEGGRPSGSRTPADRHRADSAGRRRGRAARYRPADPDPAGVYGRSNDQPAGGPRSLSSRSARL